MVERQAMWMSALCKKTNVQGQAQERRAIIPINKKKSRCGRQIHES